MKYLKVRISNGYKSIFLKEMKRFSLINYLKSFGYAFNGLKVLITEERNARIHLLAGTVVVAAGFYFQILFSEWALLALSIGFVISSEIFNTAIENISDFISPEKHVAIKRIKDLGAAAVLVSAFAALVVGVIVFLPYVIKSFIA